VFLCQNGPKCWIACVWCALLRSTINSVLDYTGGEKSFCNDADRLHLSPTIYLTVLADSATVLRPSVVCRLSVTSLCIVAKRCVLEQKLLLTAYRNSYMTNRLVPKWMTPMLRAQYIENSWRCYLPTIANYYSLLTLLWGSIRSAMSATAWLLVYRWSYSVNTVLLRRLRTALIGRRQQKLDRLSTKSHSKCCVVGGPVPRQSWLQCCRWRRRETHNVAPAATNAPAAGAGHCGRGHRVVTATQSVWKIHTNIDQLTW